MKKWMVYMAGVLLIMLSACDTKTTDLEGKWQLNRIESNGEMAVIDTVWYNFQTSLFQYQIYDKQNDQYIRQFGYNDYKEDQLSLQLISDPRPVKDFLIRTDWKEATRNFTVEKVGAKQLILSSEGRQYIFRKY